MSGVDWVKKESDGASFGDVRLNKRYEAILESFGNSPAQSIPNTFKTWSETLAAYRFMDNKSVTPSKILSPHQNATIKKIKSEKVVLIVQDTSEINFSSREPIKGMGILSSENQQGFYLHPSLAITPEKICLGLVNNHTWCRPKIGDRKNRANIPISEKESFRWIESFEISNQIAESCPSTLIVNVADREADIYELLMKQTHIASNAHWLIRSRFNRSIVTPEDEKIKSRLHDVIKNNPVMGEIEFTLPRAYLIF
jgi:hypothetical protein